MSKKIDMFPEIPKAKYTMSDTDIPAEMFEPLPEEEKLSEQINRPSLSYWQNARMKMKKDRLAMIGIVFMIILMMIAVFVPVVSPYTYDGEDYDAIYESPSSEHLMGTDQFGRESTKIGRASCRERV